MISRHGKSFAALVATAVFAGSIVLAATAAQAAVPPSCLDVTPETASAQTSSVQSATATLRGIQGATPGSGCTMAAVAVTSGTVNVDFEVTGPSDPDQANSPVSPDLSCTIATGASSCTVSYTGTTAGTDTLRGWIDSDDSNATIEADTTEGRCSTGQGDETGCGTTSPGGLTEPDGTDVVTRTWTSPVSIKQLDCAPETHSLAVGATATITCTVTNTNDATVAGVPIDVEVTGANDPDSANSPTSPDLGCTTGPAGTCSFTLHGVVMGTATYRAWIDADSNNATVEADTTEGQDSATSPGAIAEPDRTDVVTTTWTGAPATLDCDDSLGSDSERQSLPGSGPQDPSSRVSYTCTVRDAQGNAVATSITVSGENLSGINDPDATDGASFGSPDYACVTSNGACSIVVTELEDETGTAQICFWVGTAADGQTLCNSEPTGESQASGGSDTGNDLADTVEVTWVRATTARQLDCSPETSSSGVGTSVTITCTTSTSSAVVSGAQVDVEATGANDPDGANSPSSPDFTCTTNNALRMQARTQVPRLIEHGSMSTLRIPLPKPI
ncbi:MAG: hypothetical protein M3290_07820 [Actinomycetota bacterium]|nr:hypothetical protein [Actinomycetota bacterium]